MPRLVVIGTGTGVGKTTFCVALIRALRGALPNQVVAGVKPVETGISPSAASDAAALEQASVGVEPPRPHPLYAYPEPISPHLAARNARVDAADPRRVATWVADYERELQRRARAPWLVVETAGAVFSPLSPAATNYDLLVALDPAICVLVAADSLGTLHDTTVTLEALSRRGRPPEHVVLSAARLDDSTGTNAHELRLLGIATPAAVLDRQGEGLETFAHELTRGY